MMTLIFFFVAMTLGFQVLSTIALQDVIKNTTDLYNLIRVKSDKILEEIDK